jgi:hypothetical protein
MKVAFQIILIMILFFSCRSAGQNEILYNEIGEMKADGGLMQGIPVYEESNVVYNREDRAILKIRLSQPVIIDSADKEMGWGFFQFPNLGRTIDNKLVAEWNMQPDAASAYGMGGNGRAVSADGGKSWQSYEKDTDPLFGVPLKNGDLIRITTPKALKTSELKLPELIDSSRENYGRHFNYYRLHELPDNLQGVYLSRLPKGETKWVSEQAKLIDPQAARYSDNGLFPVVWWGDIRTVADGSLIAGIYPGFFVGEDNRVKPSGVFFYRSTDYGKTWNVQGRIPYEPDLKLDSNALKRYALGFTEPCFEVLKDGSFICIMRTTDGLGNSPMYISRSVDEGKTWTIPRVFTKAGVLPKILQLENGVVALASGRPGMQIRFSIDGEGAQWTDPFEMLPFDINNVKDAVSCGYPDIVSSGSNSFLLIYSDFKFKNYRGEIRKAIKVREIFVDPVK